MASILLLLSGCVYWPNERSMKVVEATSDMVDDCRLLGEVYGVSPVPFLTVGHAMAKDKAKDEAAKIGGTHVYWHSLTTAIPQEALGRVYRCGKGLPLANLDPS